MLKFKTTKTDIEKVSKIVSRAFNLGICKGRDRISVFMDLEATHSNGCELDFDKLMEFDDFNFSHDICGIAGHIDRSTGELLNCFLPRCSK